MFRGKSPGLTILWLWTFGTAAVLVANVARTRIRDMDNLVKQEQLREEAAAAAAAANGVESSVQSDQL